MANINCKACDELRQVSPELIVNGFSDDMCASLKNDTGLSPSSGNNDCADLDNLNDCLVGNMETEIEAYDICDWKTFMKRFIPNVWTTIKAVICAICGMWTNIHNLWTEVNYLKNVVIPPMPKDIIFADVSQVHTLRPGFPDGQVNRINIPCARGDGYIPMGIVGWNLSNYGSESGVSRTHPFKVKLMGDYVSIQVTNENSSNCTIIAEATVLYVKI